MLRWGITKIVGTGWSSWNTGSNFQPRLLGIFQSLWLNWSSLTTSKQKSWFWNHNKTQLNNHCDDHFSSIFQIFWFYFHLTVVPHTPIFPFNLHLLWILSIQTWIVLWQSPHASTPFHTSWETWVLWNLAQHSCNNQQSHHHTLSHKHHQQTWISNKNKHSLMVFDSW